MYSSFVNKVVIPLYDFVTKTPTRTYLRELEKSQWYNPSKIRQLQEEKLKYLIKHAYETVPYYHGIFRINNLKPSDIKEIEDLVKIPILSRNDIRRKFDTLISRRYPKQKMIYGRTGGSTGEPIRFYTTRENRELSTAARYLAWRWAGFEVGNKFAQVFGSPLDQPFFESLKGKLQDKIKRRISMNALRMSEKTLAEFVQKMKRFKPKAIYGPAESVWLLAKFIEDKGIEKINPKSVIIDSMGLFEHEVKTIERSFGCKVWWNYHNRENGTFGSECAEHSGYHLFAQNFVFEFIKKGEESTSGEAGSLVITDLSNYAMPFIRYEVGDLGVKSKELCVCGRGLPLTKKILGRTTDILVTETGSLILEPFYQFESFFDIANIRQYQIIQETRYRIIVKIVPDQGYLEKDTEEIRNLIHCIMGENIDIDIETTESIDSTKSGKRKTVIRKFPIDFSS